MIMRSQRVALLSKNVLLFTRNFTFFSPLRFFDRFQIDNQGILRTTSSNLPQNTLYNFKVKAKETGKGRNYLIRQCRGAVTKYRQGS